MKKIISLSLVLIFTMSMLFSCGAAVKESVAADSMMNASGNDYFYTKGEADIYENPSLDSSVSFDNYAEPADRKQIKNATMRIQTKEYEQFLKELSTIVDNYNGYVQSSSQNGANYGSTANRSSYVVIRIPAENFDLFKNDISAKCNVVYLDESVRDVTTAYTSLESRIAVLEAEESSLVAMLENTQKYIDADAKNYTELISTMLQVKNQLLNVQSQLAAYRAELKSYASQVAYSTISMNIYEVDRLAAVEEPETVWEEIGSKLSDNLYAIGQGARNFFVWLVTSLPYLLIWGVIIAIIAIVIVKTVKHIDKRDSSLKSREPKNNKKDNNQD